MNTKTETRIDTIELNQLFGNPIGQPVKVEYDGVIYEGYFMDIHFNTIKDGCFSVYFITTDGKRYEFRIKAQKAQT